MVASSLARNTADALANDVRCDLIDVVRDAFPDAGPTEVHERVCALLLEYPPAMLLFWLEARRIRLAVRAMQP